MTAKVLGVFNLNSNRMHVSYTDGQHDVGITYTRTEPRLWYRADPNSNNLLHIGDDKTIDELEKLYWSEK